jgi:hypothetical protein
MGGRITTSWSRRGPRRREMARPSLLNWVFARRDETMRRGSVIALAFMLSGMLPAFAASDQYGLYVAPGAVDIDRATGTSKPSVQYYVRESYPATDTLAFIQNSLANAGWRPATCAELARHEASSHEAGWRELPNEKGRASLRLWSARWVDARGNQVAYTLAYSSSLTQYALQPTYVAVAAWYEDRKEAARVRAKADEHMETLRRRYTQLRDARPCPR